MRTMTLGKTGSKVQELGMGAMYLPRVSAEASDWIILKALELGKRLLPALEKCDECGTCVEKCPYDIPTPQRVQELLEMLRS